MRATRLRHTFRLPPDLSRQLADFAGRKRVSQAAVVEAALASFLSPDGAERMEAAFSRRLDRISRQLDKLDFHVEVGNEAFALFMRRWLAITRAPDEIDAGLRAEVEKRFTHFVEALSRKIEAGARLSDDLARLASARDELG